jgi:sulfoxide reductase heme-binding subunit YedZ
MDSLLKRHHTALWWSVLALVWLPAGWLAYRYFTQNLGANGLETLQRTSGYWATIWLIATLSITPARWALTLTARHFAWHRGRRLSDWNVLIRMRRMIGVSCFGYALLHTLIYLEFDLGYDWAFLVEDLAEKPYMLAGAANLALLTLLAVTSTDTMIRRLKRNWRRIHRLIYVCALLAVAHWWWMSKPGDLRALSYCLALIALLVWRIPHSLGWLKLQGDNGMEAPERTIMGGVTITGAR